MKLVRKDSSTEVVCRHEAELQAQQLDEQSLLNPNVYPGLTGRKLWRMVRDIKVIPHLAFCLTKTATSSLLKN